MCKCSESSTNPTDPSRPQAGEAAVTLRMSAPLAEPVTIAADEGDDIGDRTILQPAPQPVGPLLPTGLRPCGLGFRDGCYAITIRGLSVFQTFEGTLRVDRRTPNRGPDNIIVSGDLYRKPLVFDPTILSPIASGTDVEAPVAPTSMAAAASRVDIDPADVVLPVRPPRIPIFPRANYHSYLKVTSVSAPVFTFGSTPCVLTLVADEFFYTQPPAGTHKGSFPATPSRTITMRLSRVPAPFPFSLTGGPFYEGRLFAGGVERGTVTLAWVSPFFRRAVLEIDTLTGAVPPAPVPAASGSGTEFFDTIFADTGWQLTVVNDQVNVPVPPGVTPTNCWSSADLHGLMTNVRRATTNLDAEWRVHLVVVPARLGCARGVMYDQIGVPREGCASFSDDGYPTGDSSNFGTAANRRQREIPRAYLRSAAHEVTHTLNQIHQEIETSADNSIMTTTPSVANVLGGPGTGAPGVFPDQIALVHNATVKQHLNHMPDPVVRPGGWPFSSWFPAGAPQAADRFQFGASELELTVQCQSERVVLGQPVELSWTLTNRAGVALRAPDDISIEATFASISVSDGEGRTKAMPAFVIACDGATLGVLEPGATRTASTRLFWSSNGFAFERPGRYDVSVAVSWSAGGVPVSVVGSTHVFVAFPLSDADNRAAALVLHPDVGKWVALGGGAYHLEQAVDRLEALQAGASRAIGEGAERARLLEGFEGLLPARRGPGRDRDATARRTPATRTAKRRTAARTTKRRK